MTTYKPDYYATLGVPRHASEAEIKLGYRRAAFKTHPDRDGGSEPRFKLVGEAYDTLSDTTKRAAYDRDNPLAGLKGAQQNAAPPSEQSTPEPQNDNLVDRVNAIVDHWNDYLDTLEKLVS